MHSQTITPPVDKWTGLLHKLTHYLLIKSTVLASLKHLEPRKPRTAVSRVGQSWTRKLVGNLWMFTTVNLCIHPLSPKWHQYVWKQVLFFQIPELHHFSEPGNVKTECIVGFSTFKQSELLISHVLFGLKASPNLILKPWHLLKTTLFYRSHLKIWPK